ncbi:MAG: 2-hydroxyacyl-CoA dehydratase [Planctomycetes bacterium]|nr:2-hydroxyacyl-CoA dehydratase [Planctomycetota bacterium]
MTQCCTQNDKPSGSRFDRMIQNCLDYAFAAKAQGRPLVGILCEYTPREMILAAGGVPVCLCGGSLEKIAPAEQHLPAGVCPLIKSTYGYHLTDSNPFLAMADLIVAETTCDGKKKMYELMAQRRPMHILELPQKANDANARTHWLAEMRKLKAELEDRLSCRITDEALRIAIKRMNRERTLRRQLAEQMKQAAPPWSGRRLLDYKSIISGIDEDLQEYERLLAMAAERRDATQAGVRMLLTGVPTVHGAERVVDLIEQAGGLVVCMENCTGIKPLLEDISEQAADPVEAIAEKYFHLSCSVMTPNTRRLEWLARLAEEYRADGVIELVWQGCLTYDVESYHVRHLAERHGLGYLKIVTDYSPSDSARLSVRIEALIETLRERKR